MKIAVKENLGRPQTINLKDDTLRLMARETKTIEEALVSEELKMAEEANQVILIPLEETKKEIEAGAK
jgi:hypothetical protein